MAGFFKDKEFSAVYYGEKAITAIYKGARLVWEAIRSCFGEGYWINKYPWNNEDAWVNTSKTSGVVVTYLRIDKKEVTLPSDGGVVTINVTSNTSWTIL